MVTEVLVRILPILLILSLGFVIRRVKLLNDDAVDRRDEMTYVNNVLSVYTAVSLIVFLVYFAMNPVL